MKTNQDYQREMARLDEIERQAIDQFSNPNPDEIDVAPITLDEAIAKFNELINKD